MVSRRRQIRVLHVPGNIGGNPRALARMERRLGIVSHSVSLHPSPFAHHADEVLFADHPGLLTREYRRLKLIARAARDFDIVHYNFGTTIADPPYPRDGKRRNRYPAFVHWPYWFYASRLQRLELQLMKRMGKVVFVTYQGNDARQGDYCARHFDISPYEAGGREFYSPVWDREKRRRIKRFDAVAAQIYALNPDLCHVLPKRARFLPYAHIDLEEWRPVTTNNVVPHVVHAPSNRAMKGTEYILAAVERLRREGVPFTFELVENRTVDEARLAYEKADLLIDQLLVGWYGGLAVELMALGKPVMCYIRQQDLRFVPERMSRQLPIIQATPGNIHDVLKRWLTKPREALQERGRKSRAFVEAWHDPAKIVKTIVRDYRQALAKRSEGLHEPGDETI